VSPLRGEKPQNWPLSKLNTGRFALRAMLPVKRRSEKEYRVGVSVRKLRSVVLGVTVRVNRVSLLCAHFRELVTPKKNNRPIIQMDSAISVRKTEIRVRS